MRVTVGQAALRDVVGKPGSVVMLMMKVVVVEVLSELRPVVLVGCDQCGGRRGSVGSESTIVLIMGLTAASTAAALAIPTVL